MIRAYGPGNLRNLSTFNVRATSQCVVTFDDEKDLSHIKSNDEFIVLGGGSNVLWMSPVVGDVLRCRLTTISPDFMVGAGALLDDVVEAACEKGLNAMAPLSGIPGTIGGAIMQNAGAYGAEIGEFVERIYCYDFTNREYVEFGVKDCKFGYRTSIFKTFKPGTFIIYKVKLKPTSNPGAKPRGEILELRSSKLPNLDEVGCAGSYFKNPVVTQTFADKLKKEYPSMPCFEHDGKYKLSAAWLIDQCGWKGYRSGNVGIWDHQPLVLCNITGKATGQEIEDLEKEVVESVNKKFGVYLIPEVVKIY